MTFFILIVGAVLSPLAHAAFFYVGEIHKAIYYTDVIAHPYLIDTANGFVKMLNITWGAAIIVLAIGWVAFAVGIVLKKTLLPRWFSIFTPVGFALMVMAIKNILPAPFSGWVGGATFNIAYLVFFLMLLIMFRTRIPTSNSELQGRRYSNKKRPTGDDKSLHSEK